MDTQNFGSALKCAHNVSDFDCDMVEFVLDSENYSENTELKDKVERGA